MATNQFSFAEACVALGVSPHTLRRRIQSGEVHAERVKRPQGFAWTVYIEQAPGSRDVTSLPSRLPGDDPASSRQEHASADVNGIHIVDGQQLAQALAPLVEASVSAAVAPLRAELADVRAMLSERDQELGRVRAVLAHVMAEKDTPAAAVEQREPWWAFWRWAV